LRKTEVLANKRELLRSLAADGSMDSVMRAI